MQRDFQHFFATFCCAAMPQLGVCRLLLSGVNYTIVIRIYKLFRIIKNANENYKSMMYNVLGYLVWNGNSEVWAGFLKFYFKYSGQAVVC